MSDKAADYIAMFALQHELLQMILENTEITMPEHTRITIETGVASGRALVFGVESLNAYERSLLELDIDLTDYPF